LIIVDLSNGYADSKFVVDGTGYVGISIAHPGFPLHVGNPSGAYVAVGGVWTDASSRENKENIKELEAQTAMEAFLQLTPVTYSVKVAPDEKHVGFIAEDVPELVATKQRDGLSPMSIVVLLTRVVQEQQKAIAELRTELDKLQGK
jgi:hypothetical protein